MPTYTMTAPNGKTYDIVGPPGASEDDVRNEILRRDPTAGQPPAARPAAPAPQDHMAPLRDIGNVVGSAFKGDFGPAQQYAAQEAKPVVDAWNKLGSDVQADYTARANELKGNPSLGWAIDGDKRAAGILGDAANVAGSGVNALFHGAAIRPLAALVTAANPLNPTQIVRGPDGKIALQQTNAQDTNENILGTALMGLGPEAGKLAGPMADGAAARAARQAAGVTNPIDTHVVQPLKDVATAGQTAANTAAQMRDATVTDAANTQADAQEQAALNAMRADRLERAAAQARAQGTSLFRRGMDARANAATPALNIGVDGQLSDLGDTVSTPAKANAAQIEADMQAANDKYRAAMNQVVAEQEANGVGVSDTQAAKTLIAKSKAIVEPDPVARPGIGNVPADSAGAKLHREALDVLQPTQVPLDDVQAAQAYRDGVPMEQAADGSFYRIIKPSAENVDEFRRKVGKVLGGKIEGYEAVNRLEAGKLYDGLTNVLDEYSKGTSPPVQANWAAGKAALAPYENSTIGRALTGTQTGTGDLPSVPASGIMRQIVGSGRDGVQQAMALSGRSPVLAALRGQVQNTLAGAKTADAASALVRPGTELGDAIAGAGDDQLTAAVSDYLNRMRISEENAAQADRLAQRAAASTSRADTWDKIAAELRGTAGKAADTATSAEQRIAQVSALPDKDVANAYRQMLTDQHSSRQIGTDDFNKGMALASSADRAFALKSMRLALLKNAGIAAGAGAIPFGLGAAPAVTAGAAALGLGAGIFGRNMRLAAMAALRKP